MAPQRATAYNVFTSTYNSTNFPFAYVCCISILSTLFSFSGYEGNEKKRRKKIQIKILIFYSWCTSSRRNKRCRSSR
jgi:hypothetical protein